MRITSFISMALLTMVAAGTLSCEKKAPALAPLIVEVDQTVAQIQPTMWGIFFEDINFGADGGIYAELVKNRSFEFAIPRMGWSIQQASDDSSHFVIINRGQTHPENPRFMRVKVDGDKGPWSMTNSGFRGMGLKQGVRYLFSVLAARPEGSTVTMNLSLLAENGEVLGQATVTPQNTDWAPCTATMECSRTDARGRLRIEFQGNGQLDLDMVSLFPSDTWNNRQSGLRADLVSLLAGLQPGFLRFPGGCIVEGRELATRYQWKKTIGDPASRQLIVNRWNTEFAHRPTPDYFQSFGLGFYEYFQLAEDIGAEPLPILNCGMACQFNTAELVPMEQLDEYVQDALDLIEFANGPADSPWGSIRASMGHPEPFGMKYLGIGNEQWGPQYFERYAVFEKAIRERYPDIQLVSGTGPAPSEKLFDFAQEELKKYTPELVDEHYYRNPEWFLENATRYDNYDRNSYKIFAGEYAAQSEFTCSPDNKNNWECALAEAAFMTGLERNADVVHMTSYAPLFGHLDAWQWTPNLIWFDNLNAYGTPNYYVQQMFSLHRGTDLLRVLQEGKPLTGQNGIYASAVWDSATHEVVVKVVNAAEQAQTCRLTLNTDREILPEGELIVLQSKDKEAVNSIAQPQLVAPESTPLALNGKELEVKLTPQSLTVVRVRTR